MAGRKIMPNNTAAITMRVFSVMKHSSRTHIVARETSISHTSSAKKLFRAGLQEMQRPSNSLVIDVSSSRSRTTLRLPVHQTVWLYHEIFGSRMMHDDGGRRLLWIEQESRG